jgi:phage terminase small subunit
MLTEQKKQFARNYIANGGNATQAALKAGYSKKSAYSQGQRLLKDVEVKQMLEKEQKKNAEKYEYTIENCLREFEKLKKIALERKNPLGSPNPDVSSAIKAQENIGKLCGFYIEKKEISGLDQTPLEIKILK